MQTKFRLAENQNEVYVRRVFNNAATRVVKDSFSDARIKAVTVYYKTVKKEAMTNKEASSIHLTAEQYHQSYVDWLSKDPESWRWLCEYWASEEFKSISDRNRSNRKSKPGLHFYGADGHVGKSQRMVGSTCFHNCDAQF